MTLAPIFIEPIDRADAATTPVTSQEDTVTTATEPKIEKITLTPALATALLEANTRNRSLRPRFVGSLAEAIRRGEWMFDGAPIRVSEDGTLLDGQHRCAAVAKAGIPVQTLLITGLPAETQIVMDSGRTRRFADHLKILGVPDYNHYASATRLLWNYREGTLGWRGSWLNRPDPSFQQLMVLFQEEREALEMGVRTARGIQRAISDSNRSAVTVAKIVFTLIDPDDSEDFFEKFRTGAGLEDGHPVLVLRRLLFNRTRKTKLDAEHQLAVQIKGWNAYRAGQSVKMLVYRPGGAYPESFPKPE